MLLFIEGVFAISYRVELFCVSFFLYFLLLCCVCFLFTLCMSCLCQYVTKRRRNSWSVGILFVLFRGSWNCFLVKGDTMFVFGRGRYYVSCFVLLIYLYLWVIHWYMSLFWVEWNQEFILFTCIFHTCIYVSCLVF